MGYSHFWGFGAPKNVNIPLEYIFRRSFTVLVSVGFQDNGLLAAIIGHTDCLPFSFESSVCLFSVFLYDRLNRVNSERSSE